MDIETNKTMTEASFSISRVHSKEDLAIVKKLFGTYTASLGIDLSYQDYDTELANLPGKYAPPHGALFLAKNADNDPIGCVGLRPLLSAGDGFCEMKRLYVSPQGRGMGIGKALAERVINEATWLGYKAVVLDTLATMASARKIYKLLGFFEVKPYYESPIEGTVFLQRELG